MLTLLIICQLNGLYGTAVLLGPRASFVYMNCNPTDNVSFVPPFCNDQYVYSAVMNAYNALWDNIKVNEAQLQSEVWSWTYNDDGANNGTSRDGYTTVPLGALPPPPGVGGGTESNIRQLWS